MAAYYQTGSHVTQIGFLQLMMDTFDGLRLQSYVRLATPRLHSGPALSACHHAAPLACCRHGDLPEQVC
jgi:hypothetical protein